MDVPIPIPMLTATFAVVCAVVNAGAGFWLPRTLGNASTPNRATNHCTSSARELPQPCCSCAGRMLLLECRLVTNPAGVRQQVDKQFALGWPTHSGMLWLFFCLVCQQRQCQHSQPVFFQSVVTLSALKLWPMHSGLVETRSMLLCVAISSSIDTV